MILAMIALPLRRSYHPPPCPSNRPTALFLTALPKSASADCAAWSTRPTTRWTAYARRGPVKTRSGKRSCWRRYSTPVALVLPIALAEKILLVGVLMLVLIVELLNSAIEAAVDRDSLEINPLGKRAKDVGSAAVMLALMLAGGTWVAIVGWYFFRA